MVPQEKDYPDMSCHRRRIDLNQVAQVPDTGNLLLSMYECPNPYQNEKRYRNKHLEDVKFSIPVRFLLTGGYFRNSVVLIYTHAGTRPPPIKFFIVFLGVISLKELQHLYFENRKKVYEKQIEPRKFTKKVISRSVGKEDLIQRYQHTADSKILNNNSLKKKPSKYYENCKYKYAYIVKLCVTGITSTPMVAMESKGAKMRSQKWNSNGLGSQKLEVEVE